MSRIKQLRLVVHASDYEEAVTRALARLRW